MIDPRNVQRLMFAGEQDESRETQQLYANLIVEEFTETLTAYEAQDRVEILDGGIDLIWVALGFLLANGFTVDQIEAAWREVAASNMSKIDERTGRVMKREDGKILKPAGYFKPNLAEILEREE